MADGHLAGLRVDVSVVTEVPKCPVMFAPTFAALKVALGSNPHVGFAFGHFIHGLRDYRNVLTRDA